jgi:uncharacterized protein YecE (DUF72 family)
MRLFVGQPATGGDLRRYANRFNLLELKSEPGMPKAATLRRWLGEAPPDFAFSVVLPENVSALDGSPIDEPSLARAIEAADLLAAHWLVLRTPPSARPSARTRRRLEELIARLPRAERRIAWEPRGLWEDEDAEAAAHALDVHLVRDIARTEAPDEQILYARLRALGGGGRIGSGALERAIDELEEREAAYVVVEGAAGVRAAKMLRAAFGTAALAEDEDDADDDDLDDEDEDEDEDELDEDEDQ